MVTVIETEVKEIIITVANSSDNSNRSRVSYNSNYSRGRYSSNWRRDSYRRDSRGSYNSERYNNNNGENFSDRGSYISDRGNWRGDYNNNSHSRIETQTIYNTAVSKEPKCKLCGKGHWIQDCTEFTTPAEKQAKLREMGHCDKCSYIKKSWDHECKLRYQCRKCKEGDHLECLCTQQAENTPR